MRRLLKKPSAWVPLAIPLAALIFIIGYATVHGIEQTPARDEGAPARFFQLSMVADAMIMIFFAMRWLPRMPKQALLILSLQIVAAMVPIGLIIILETR